MVCVAAFVEALQEKQVDLGTYLEAKAEGGLSREEVGFMLIDLSVAFGSQPQLRSHCNFEVARGNLSQCTSSLQK